MKKWAIITGASSGIGKEMATLLAQKGYALLLVARSLPALQSLAAELRKTFGLPVEPIELDLAQPDAARRLDAILTEKGITVEVLINNAGVGYYGTFTEQEPGRLEAMMTLNMQTPAMLTQLFAQRMLATGKGYILQVASTAAFIPMPRLALYAATKGFLLQLSLALHAECHKGGVIITTLCPGPTRTKFFEAASFTNGLSAMELLSMSSKSVAKAGIKGLFAGKRVVIPGMVNKLTSWSSNFTPSSLLVAATDQMMKRR